jgi:exopolysaccharide biosynthesis polyprenyl glycosylphosphotransferase
MEKATRTKLFITLSYEALVFSAAFLLVRNTFGALMRSDAVSFSRLVLIMALFFTSYFYLMWRDLYSRNYHYYLKRTYRIVLKNTTMTLLLVFVVLAVLSSFERFKLLPALLVYLPVAVLSFFVVHGSHYMWIRYLSHIGYFRRNCLIIGKPSAGFSPEATFQDIGNTRNYVGRLYREHGRWKWDGRPIASRHRVASLRDIQSLILKENIGDIIFVLGDGLRKADLPELLHFCQALAISYFLVPDLSGQPDRHGWNRVFPQIPLMERFAGKRDSLTNISLKRLLDLLIAVPALLLFMPLGLLIALAIKLEDGGPVFYTTMRIGKNGRPIRFYKFRTMMVGADRQKPGLLRFNLRSDGPLFKMQNDPRVTRVGRLLRNFSLDEFPQMLNVLQGNMSLVGPRPHLPEEVAKYKDGDYLRLECIPGIVGLPQIAGRNTLGFVEWVSLDLKYRRTWSLAQDIRIMVRTAKIVLASWLKPRAPGF